MSSSGREEKCHPGRHLLVSRASQAMDITWEGDAVDHRLQSTTRNRDGEQITASSDTGHDTSCVSLFSASHSRALPKHNDTKLIGSLLGSQSDKKGFAFP